MFSRFFPSFVFPLATWTPYNSSDNPIKHAWSFSVELWNEESEVDDVCTTNNISFVGRELF
jgi:hypothetical protein